VVSNGADALRELASDSFDLLLLDLQMPQVSGLQVLREVRNAGLKTAVVIISGTSDVSTAVEAMRLGAMDYIVKPFLPDHFVGVLRRCFETLRAEKREFAPPRAQWRPALKDNTDETLEGLMVALNAREHHTQHHSKRVGDFTDYLCGVMGIAEPLRGMIRKGALIHDIGKIGIPDHILLKPGPLTADEQKVVREHVRIGYEMVSSLESLKGVAEIVLTHHEFYDGTGYPQGLKGEAIPIGARILTIVDAFDAMTSCRPYRRAASYEEASEEIRLGSGTRYDPALTRTFLGVPRETWDWFRAPALAAAATTW
jgi:putative nucleotidyltransferase with HDIG domain